MNKDPTSILFITSSRIGDAVLSTGLLDAVLQEYEIEPKVEIACGPLAASLFEGVPGLHQIHILRKQSFNRHWLSLWRQCVGQRWDTVIDIRNSIVSRLVPARRKLILGRSYPDLHKVEANATLLGREDNPPCPRIWTTHEQNEAAQRILKPENGPVIAVAPVANWIGKTWPSERFLAVLESLSSGDGPFAESRIAVFAAPDEREQAQPVLDGLDRDRCIDCVGAFNPGEAAAALRLCAFFIGNDSGLMHCAAAAGAPTLGLFGPSYPQHYRPWGDQCRYAATPESFDALISCHPDAGHPGRIKQSLMTSLDVDTVVKTAQDMIRQTIDRAV